MAPIKGNVDFSHLSDEELGQTLTTFGVSIGPINVSTRKTYERRLQKLQTGLESPPTQHFEAVPDDDDEDDDEEVQIRVPQQTHAPSPTVASHPEPAQPRLRRDFQDTSSYSYTPRIESRANLNAARKTTSLYSDTRLPPRSVQRTSAAPPAPTSSRSDRQGIPLWVKLVAVLAIALLAYLIYSNMEPQAVSNIPGVSQKVEV